MNSAKLNAPSIASIASLVARFGPDLAVHPSADLPLPVGTSVIDYSLTRLRAGHRAGGQLREVAAQDAAFKSILIEAAAFDPVEQLRHELFTLTSAGNADLRCGILVRERKRVAGIRRVMGDYFEAVDEQVGGGATLLSGTTPRVAEAPAKEPLIEIADPRTRAHYLLETAPGLFSGEMLDRGTAVLLQSLPYPAGGRAIDVGSGYGPLTVVLAGRGLDTTYVDVDARALRMTGRNLARNGLSGTALASADLREIAPASCDLAVSNPPTHAGSDVLRRLFERMADALNVDGRMMLVVRQHLNYEKWLEPLGRLQPPRVEAGYKVLTVLPR